MKTITTLIALALIASISLVQAADKAGKAKEKVKAYPLKTCAVSDEKLGDMGDPYVFEHEGQEIKLCCKSCMKDFKKDSAKIMKKIAKANKKSAK
ncbi:MAG: hypothetical protein FJ404_08765 [Verrucomicrobia bacterium]|nr:hypothetical protein [Verrucomicrobiota bacterium]